MLVVMRSTSASILQSGTSTWYRKNSEQEVLPVPVPGTWYLVPGIGMAPTRY